MQKKKQEGGRESDSSKLHGCKQWWSTETKCTPYFDYCLTVCVWLSSEHTILLSESIEAKKQPPPTPAVLHHWRQLPRKANTEWGRKKDSQLSRHGLVWLGLVSQICHPCLNNQAIASGPSSFSPFYNWAQSSSERRKEERRRMPVQLRIAIAKRRRIAVWTLSDMTQSVSLCVWHGQAVYCAAKINR